MKRAVQVLLLGAAAALAVWLWTVLFPSPERAIRSRLADLAKTVSRKAGEGNFSKVYSLQKLPDFFTPDVVVTAEIRGYSPATVEGRDDLVHWIAGGRESFAWIKIEVVDINVTLDADKQTAVANLTAKATASGQSDLFVQEFNFMFRKVDGKWLIYRIETVKTLSRAEPPVWDSDCRPGQLRRVERARTG